ncbi:hypothetical protein, partial [uncultured Mucilaginibacter sp.]|uniref:hypothetical protein n=1 Tax=uncultured Mucilaginibacter sp. TaxID=797541 RepID=UPI0025EC832D
LFEFEFYDEILFMADPNDFWEEKMAYVSRYAAFTLDNYAQWTTINSRLEVILNKEQAAIDEAEKARQRRKRIKRLWLYILMAVLTAMALALIILNYAAYVGKTLSSKFEVDLYQFGICLLIFAVPYLMLRVVYRLWKMAKKF